MARPYRPDPARRSAVRRSERVRTSVRRGTAAAAAVPRSGAALTTRAAVLGLVLCALVVSGALPLREFLTQRGRIAGLQEAQAAQRARVTALEQERQRLDDPAYVARLARERLHFVQPGETAYVVIGAAPPPAPTAVGADQARAGRNAPWYSQMYGSLVTADQPVP